MLAGPEPALGTRQVDVVRGVALAEIDDGEAGLRDRLHARPDLERGPEPLADRPHRGASLAHALEEDLVVAAVVGEVAAAAKHHARLTAEPRAREAVDDEIEERRSAR